VEGCRVVSAARGAFGVSPVGDMGLCTVLSVAAARFFEGYEVAHCSRNLGHGGMGVGVKKGYKGVLMLVRKLFTEQR